MTQQPSSATQRAALQICAVVMFADNRVDLSESATIEAMYVRCLEAGGPVRDRKSLGEIIARARHVREGTMDLQHVLAVTLQGVDRAAVIETVRAFALLDGHISAGEAAILQAIAASV
jgi:uncharacterized tellurite resistance protein B-like protein